MRVIDSTRRAFAGLGVGGTLVACFAPWSHYGGAYPVFALPLWGCWLATAAALHAVSLLRLFRDPPWLRSVGVGLGVATLAVALLVQKHFDDGAAIHGAIVPLVRPYPGVGLLFAVAGAAFATGAASLTGRGGFSRGR
jgi:hypothetical protein